MKKSQFRWASVGVLTFALLGVLHEPAEAQSAVSGTWEGRAVAGSDATAVILHVDWSEDTLRTVLDLLDLWEYEVGRRDPPS